MVIKCRQYSSRYGLDVEVMSSWVGVVAVGKVRWDGGGDISIALVGFKMGPSGIEMGSSMDWYTLQPWLEQ